jgi:hypothetical protein
VIIFLNVKKYWAAGVTQVVEYLPSKRESLSSNPSTTKERKKERKKEMCARYFLSSLVNNFQTFQVVQCILGKTVPHSQTGKLAKASQPTLPKALPLQLQATV